jgi:hypothetical protein
MLDSEVHRLDGLVVTSTKLLESLELTVCAAVFVLHTDVEDDRCLKICRCPVAWLALYPQCPIASTRPFSLLHELGRDIDLIAYILNDLGPTNTRIICTPAIHSHAIVLFDRVPQFCEASQPYPSPLPLRPVAYSCLAHPAFPTLNPRSNFLGPEAECPNKDWVGTAPIAAALRSSRARHRPSPRTQVRQWPVRLQSPVAAWSAVGAMTRLGRAPAIYGLL